MNVLVNITFDGTNYHGTQIQSNADTVFSRFQNALVKVLGKPTDIKACSRLDSGVHANCFYLSFYADDGLDVRHLHFALNYHLPPDIRALGAEVVPDGFHRRYSCKGKEYTYYMWNSHTDNPFLEKYYYRVPQKLNVDLMNEAAQHFVGTHDFTSFMASNSKITDCVRTVSYAKVERDGDMVKFIVCADGFLYNMVRIMAGTLIRAGRGYIAPNDVKTIIESKDRHKAGVTVPAKGLFLSKVIY